MTLTLVIASSLSAAVGSLCTGYSLKLIEHRRDAKDAAKLEVERKRAIARFEAIRKVNGLARELYHAVSRLVWHKGGDGNFDGDRIQKLCRAMQ
jgi:hypothetical protein